MRLDPKQAGHAETTLGRLMMALSLSFTMASVVIDFISPAERNVTVMRGQTAILPCEIRNLDIRHKVVWVHNDMLLTVDERRMIDDARISIERPFVHDWNLHIREVDVDDRGWYKCFINTTPVQNVSVLLHVVDTAEPPTVVVETEHVRVHLGETARLVCKATGTPTPVISWFRESPESMGPGQQIGGSGEVLLIHNTSVECGGKYFCRADNGVEPLARGTVNVLVLYSPEINAHTRRIGQVLGMSTVLVCEYKSSFDKQQARFWWFKEGQIISNDDPRYVVSVTTTLDNDDSYLLRLHIDNLKAEDYGMYTCTAENGGDSHSDVVSLFEIMAPVVMSNAEDQTTNSPSMEATIENSASMEDTDIDVDVTVKEGDTTYLPCQARGLHFEEGSNVKVTWRDRLSLPLSVNELMITSDTKYNLYKEVFTEGNNGDNVQDANDDGEAAGVTTYFLTIETVDRRYSGLYTCSIDSGAASLRINVHLHVNVPPVVITDNFVKLADTGLYGLGCYAAGIPSPTVSWLWANNSTYIQSGEVLPLDGIPDLFEHSFVCMADNSLGVTRQVVKPPVPGPPVNVTTVFVGDDMSSPGVTVSWKPAEVTHGTILRYRFKLSGPSQSMDGGSNADSLYFTYYSTEDRPMKYNLSIYAVNEIGRGPSVDLAVIIPNDASDAVAVHQGNTATLVCNIYNVGNKQVLWMDKNKRVIAIGSIMMNIDLRLQVRKVDRDTTHLLISSVTPEDDGFYYCALQEAPIRWTKLYLTVL